MLSGVACRTTLACGATTSSTTTLDHPSGANRHPHYHVALLGKEVICLFGLRQPERRGQQLLVTEPPGPHNGHETSHPLLAARAQRRDHRVVAEPRRKSIQRHAQMSRVN